MPQTKYIQSNFNGGILAPQMFGRTDQARYFTSVADMENFIPTIFGDVKRRPGMRYFGQAMGPSRLIPFRLNVAHTYLLEFGNQLLRFWTPNGQIRLGGVPYQIATPYDTSVDDLWDIKFAEQNDVMYLVHPNHPVMRLNHNSDTNWTLIQPVFDPPAIDRFNTDVSGGTITLTLGAVSGTGVTFTASAPVFIQGDIGKAIVSGQGVAYIRSLAGTTAVDPMTGATLYPQAIADIIDPFVNLVPIPAGSWFLFGSPQSYFSIGNPHGSFSGNWAASRKLGVHGAQDAYTYSSFPEETSPAPSTVDSFRTTDVGRWIFSGGAVIKIIAVVSSTHVTIDPYSAFTETFTDSNGVIRIIPIAGGAWSIRDPVFTGINGYATSVGFFQGRLWLGGASTKATTVYSSVTQDYENFSPGNLDNQGMAFTEDSGQFDQVEWVQAFQGQLVTGNLQSEWAIGAGGVGSNGVAVTPSNINTLIQSQYGSSRIQGIVVENQLLYVQRALTKLFEFAYSIYTTVFASKDLTTFAAALDPSGFKEMVYQQTPDRVVWFTTNAGNLFGLTYMRENDVWGWHRHTTATGVIPGGSLFSLRESQLSVELAMPNR